MSNEEHAQPHSTQHHHHFFLPYLLLFSPFSPSFFFFSLFFLLNQQLQTPTTLILLPVLINFYTMVPQMIYQDMDSNNDFYEDFIVPLKDPAESRSRGDGHHHQERRRKPRPSRQHRPPPLTYQEWLQRDTQEAFMAWGRQKHPKPSSSCPSLLSLAHKKVKSRSFVRQQKISTSSSLSALLLRDRSSAVNLSFSSPASSMNNESFGRDHLIELLRQAETLAK